jgi:hypothetical protein
MTICVKCKKLFSTCQTYLPARRCQFGNFTGRVGADAVKHISEIFKWINLTQLATGNQTVDDSGELPSTSLTEFAQWLPPIVSEE